MERESRRNRETGRNEVGLGLFDCLFGAEFDLRRALWSESRDGIGRPVIM